MARQPRFDVEHIENQLLENLARGSRVRADSYRQFKVGAAELFFTGTIYVVFSGANIKRSKDGQKICAEGMACNVALKTGVLKLLKLAVCGPPQKDSRSGKESPTLHPCGECRTYLKSLYRLGVVKDDLLIITRRPIKGGITEYHTLRTLLAFHGEEL